MRVGQYPLRSHKPELARAALAPASTKEEYMSVFVKVLNTGAEIGIPQKIYEAYPHEFELREDKVEYGELTYQELKIEVKRKGIPFKGNVSKKKLIEILEG